MGSSVGAASTLGLSYHQPGTQHQQPEWRIHSVNWRWRSSYWRSFRSSRLPQCPTPPAAEKAGFGTATVQDVRITPCSDPRRCVLKKNTNVAIEIDYTPTQNSTGPMTASAAWAMSNAQLPLPNMDTDACKTTTCPVKIGNRQTYTYNLHISPVYPPRNYNVKWTLTARPFFMCIHFPIRIVN